ncbi:MAG: copper-translocating P-type ATPase [Firmicutes bacterium]|nr:copper-translocating P-type ATPase [Bacillota bacterium]
MNDREKTNPKQDTDMGHGEYHHMEMDSKMDTPAAHIEPAAMSPAAHKLEPHQQKEPISGMHESMGSEHHHKAESKLGEPMEMRDHESHDHHAMMVDDFRRRFIVSLFITVPILVLSPMIQMFLGLDLRFNGDTYILLGLATILYIYGGRPFITGAKDELQQHNPGMMTLIALGITVAYVYSVLTVFVLTGTDFFWELATLIVIMLLGHWIEMKSVMGASRALEELVKLMPDEAHLITAGGETIDIAVGSLKADDPVLVKSGEKIPIDGLVFDGHSTVNEAMITGESTPVDKEPGDQVIGGALNGEGVLKFKVTKTGRETYLSQIIILVREAQKSRSKTQRLADTSAKWLFYIAVISGSITFAVWMTIRGDLGFALERAVTVMVICCPHALGLAIPLVTAVSTSIAARRGLLIRNRAHFENARNVNTVIFDKTGTLTEGQFGITDIQAFGISPEELLSISYSIESQSAHPISQGIVREAKKHNSQLLGVQDYQSITGRGLIASIDGRSITVLSPGFMRAEKIAFDENQYEILAQQGKTVVFVVEEDRLLGYIALSDIVRDSARQAIDALKAMNIESYMITGDNRRVADYVAKQLNIDKVFAEVLPEGKALQVQAIKREGKKVAMTGDGVNDAPALAQADLGIAIGAGTDVAIETADVILVRSNPLDVVSILKLSRATYGKMVQNLWWATGYNIIALPLAAGVLYNQGIVISPAMGAVLMSMSTMIVAINARLLRID